MMKFIRAFNRLVFERTFNAFDIMVIFYITVMLAESIWWLALYIPTILFSVYMQQLVEHERS